MMPHPLQPSLLSKNGSITISQCETINILNCSIQCRADPIKHMASVRPPVRLLGRKAAYAAFLLVTDLRLDGIILIEHPRAIFSSDIRCLENIQFGSPPSNVAIDTNKVVFRL